MPAALGVGGGGEEEEEPAWHPDSAVLDAVDLLLVPPASFRTFEAMLEARDAELVEVLAALPPLAPLRAEPAALGLVAQRRFEHVGGGAGSGRAPPHNRFYTAGLTPVELRAVLTDLVRDPKEHAELLARVDSGVPLSPAQEERLYKLSRTQLRVHSQPQPPRAGALLEGILKDRATGAAGPASPPLSDPEVSADAGGDNYGAGAPPEATPPQQLPALPRAAAAVEPPAAQPVPRSGGDAREGGGAGASAPSPPAPSSRLRYVLDSLRSWRRLKDALPGGVSSASGEQQPLPGLLIVVGLVLAALASATVKLLLCFCCCPARARAVVGLLCWPFRRSSKPGGAAGAAGSSGTAGAGGGLASILGPLFSGRALLKRATHPTKVV